jgi:hypothetical protein
MKRLLRFAIVLIVALALVPFLPLYVERTMMRSWRVDGGGDLIEWGWKLCTLRSFWSDYSYFRPEQRPALWLGVNLALGFTYALVIALVIDKFFARRERRDGRVDRTLN